MRYFLVPRLVKALLSFLLVLLVGLAPPVEATWNHRERGPAQRSSGHPPNIVLILTDDLDLQLGSLDAMPFTRALLAAQGMSFSNAYTPAPLCCPARASLLTGQYAHNHHIYTNAQPDGGFDKFRGTGGENATVATALQAASYRTALVGKYLNGYPRPDDPTYIPPGWDEWIVPTEGAYGYLRYQLNENGRLVDYGGTSDDYLTDVLARKTTDFITSTAIFSPTTPFFVAVSLIAPHEPALPAARHRTLFPGAQAPRSPSFNEADLSDKPPHVQAQPLLSETDRQRIDELYRKRLQALQAVDEMIGQVVRALARMRQLDNTYILLTSDNGYHMGQHRFLPGKGRPYEEDIRVPLLVRGPGVPQDVVRDELVSLADLAPTLAEIAGTDLAVPADGRSLLPLLHSTAPAAGWRQAVLIEHYPEPSAAQARGRNLPNPSTHDAGRPAGRDQLYADFVVVRTAMYKYIERGHYARELYDLTADPYELENLIRHADLLLVDQLSAWGADYHACTDASCRSVDAREPPRLRVLFRQIMPLVEND